MNIFLAGLNCHSNISPMRSGSHPSSLRRMSYKDRRQILPRVRILYRTVMQAQGITFTLLAEMQ